MRTLPSLPFAVKVAYGIGELAAAVPVSLSAFFILYFLTEVAGLNPALAGGVLLIGRVWDAINDPVVGWLSDRTQSPLGRRFPWMLAGAGPLAICSVLMWSVPPITRQWGLFLYYGGVSLVTFAAFTAVQLPYTAMAAELSEDYDERTALIGVKSVFGIGGSILGLVMAQIVFEQVANSQQQYLILGGLAAGLAIITTGVCVAGTYRRYWQLHAQRPNLHRHAIAIPLVTGLRSVLQNAAFRQVLGLYFCGWVGFQLTAAMLPYFVDAWMRLPETHFSQMALAVQGTAVVMIFAWNQITRWTDKRTVFLLGVPIAAIALAGLITVHPGQIRWMYALGVLAGTGVATMYVVPFAMLPDVIDLDELKTGLRREGLYFSAVVFLQKLGLAIALFISGQLLDWVGFTPNAVAQPTQVLWTIRLLIGPLPAILLMMSLWFAYRYPINRQHHQQILIALEAKRTHRNI